MINCVTYIIFITDSSQRNTNRSIFDEPTHECDDPFTYYDGVNTLNGGETCSAQQFQNYSKIIPIHDMTKYKDLYTCCEGHSYVFRDLCEVII